MTDEDQLPPFDPNGPLWVTSWLDDDELGEWKMVDTGGGRTFRCQPELAEYIVTCVNACKTKEKDRPVTEERSSSDLAQSIVVELCANPKATQDRVARAYVPVIICLMNENRTDAKVANDAITERWSVSALVYIKGKAWESINKRTKR